MGFVEVLMNLRTIFRNLKFCKEDILANRPDALILIDYPGLIFVSPDGPKCRALKSSTIFLRRSGPGRKAG